MQSADAILDLLLSWKQLRPRDAAAWRNRLRCEPQLRQPDQLLKQLVRCGKLTQFQAARIHHDRQHTLVVGEYVLFERVGSGAMGRVFKAYDRGRKRWVALKVLRSKWNASPRHLKRFQREIRAARRLRHPNIVRALGAGCVDSMHFLAMEYVHGPNLETYLREHEPLSVATAVQFTLQAARGLSFAHQQGWIHRDIKPSNLLVGPDGEVKILDMGIARMFSGEEDAALERLTHSGQVLGTPHYMAPEQALDPRNASPQCDIYALGCTLYRMLTGVLPYQGESDFEMLLAHLRAPTPALSQKRPDTPASLDAICRRMMAKEPVDRYESFESLIGDLERLQTESSAPSALLATLDVTETETITDVEGWRPEPPQRRRWRMAANENLTPQVRNALPEPAPITPPSPAPPREPKPALPAPYVRGRRPRPRIKSGPAAPQRRVRLRRAAALWCACATAAITIAAGLSLAAITERRGWISLEVYPGEALVEVFNDRQDLTLRQRASGELLLPAAPGGYCVKVTKRGFVPYVRDFSLESGGRKTIRAVLARE